ncbi:MAG: CehA/McbA family metallohydrolase [Acidobacteriota bacterium]|nr:CehA/McbA family metallohydrolase [Acidobacteriota bacterium]
MIAAARLPVFLALLLALASPDRALAQVYPAAKTGGNYMHNYYFAPAASSTPWWPSWSPDGSRLAFAMDGSIWTIDLGSTVAKELVFSPRGYLSMPEFSPDGRWLAYTEDDDAKSINLRLLNLATGATTNLTTGSDVNHEPAWSPDGRRLAYVSTAPNGYFNVYVMEIADGKPGKVTQITTDHAFGRDRLYFGDVDVHISPAWSPDGRELLLVSNRGIPLGSGGIWRVPVEPNVMAGSQATLIHKEETLYRTRPQWSPDGKRMVYASHLGGQYTELFVLPTVGGEPYKMTFGEHDHFLPRWSPDGEWIAYISNEEGLPQLKLMKAWGGEQRLVRITERRHARPMGTVAVRIVDDATGEPMAARVYQRASDGKPYTPGDSYERLAALNRHLFHTPGRYVTSVPPGALTIEVARGFEYEVTTTTVDVKAGSTTDVTIRLKRMVDFLAKGWRSGSNHVHMNYAGNLHNTPENMMRMAEAEDMGLTSLQIANKDNRILDYQYFTPGQSLHPLSSGNYVMHVGQEYRPPFYGHISLFNLTEHLISPFVTGYEGTGIESLYPSNTDIFRYAREQGGIGAYVHPFAGDADPLEGSLGTAKGFPVDVALETVSYHELWSQSAGDAPLLVWYHALNNGFRVPVTGGEDSISSLHRVELVGVSRGYFHLGDQPFTWQAWMRALLAGRGFVTNGPLLEFSANAAAMGEEVALPAGGGRVTFTGALHSIVPLERFELVSNGQVVHTFPLTGDRRSATFDLPIDVKTSGWYSLRAIGKPGTFPTENTRPQAVTNPIYVIVDSQPIRSQASANYFVKWIDKLTTMAAADPGWRSDTEKAHVLGQFRDAREIYLARGKQAAAAGRP